MIKKIFGYQIWHLVSVIILIAVTQKFISISYDTTNGELGFSLLFVCRMISIIILAMSNQGSLSVNPLYTYLIAALITPVIIYLFYSVIRYFTFERAFGIDHFDKNYNQPYVKEGIFRYTDNGMYVYGILVLYLPGLLLLSKTALIVALFNHLYIWVHYYCTERPDMKVIYGKMPEN